MQIMYLVKGTVKDISKKPSHVEAIEPEAGWRISIDWATKSNSCLEKSVEDDLTVHGGSQNQPRLKQFNVSLTQLNVS